MFRALSPALLLLALPLAAGCQSKPSYALGRVEGTVSKDGKPLPGVVVIFWGDAEGGAAGPHSSGPTDAAGHYHLHTDLGEDGALVGKHRVCIVDNNVLLDRVFARGPGRNKRLQKEEPPATPSVVSPNYGRKTETPLRADVQSGGQVLDFEVK